MQLGKSVSLRGVLFFLTLFSLMGTHSIALEDSTIPGKDSAAINPSQDLPAIQESIEMRYRRFENSLEQLSEYLRKTDPSRTELLRRAMGKSKEGGIPDQLHHLSDLLKKDQLGDAFEDQEKVLADLQLLLELLMSEARKDEIELEKKRIRNLIKEVGKLIGKETDARNATERGNNDSDLQNGQQKVADSTKELMDKIESQDAAKKTNHAEQRPDSEEKLQKKVDKEEKDGKQSPNDQQPKSETPSDQEAPKKGDPEQGNSPPSKPKAGKKTSGTPDDKKDQDQPPSEGEEKEDPQEKTTNNEDDRQRPQDKTPGRDELKRAKREMDKAIQELKKNNKKAASDKQDKAIAELMKAKEKLEEILRLVREEERELVLVQMEARFRDMLQKQEAIYNATLAIHAVPSDSHTDRHRNRSVELARNEEAISLLADKALTLLKEEGSSVAFPEAVEQVREDMLTISRRLERVDVGEITQNIEQDSIESLKEIIDSMQKELEKLKDKKQQQRQDQKQQKQEQPQQQQQGLINRLAELKMLRSLQFRVNRRTKQLGRMVDGEQSLDNDVISQLKQLSDRQAKVQKATYDLATGKNQ